MMNLELKTRRPAARTNLSEGSLVKALDECAASFESFAQGVHNSDIPETPLSTLSSVWDRHYLCSFHQFDRLLQEQSKTVKPPEPRLIAISISHHNLHRLMEVLALELDGKQLGATRSPERIMDFREVVDRLRDLLNETTQSYRLGETNDKSSKGGIHA